MSELISGKEALIALANGEIIEVKSPHDKWYCDWGTIDPRNTKLFLRYFFDDDYYKFRLKPETVKITIEVPAPFKPKHGQKFYYLNDEYDDGFSSWTECDNFRYIAVWRTEEEIKQVVEALRSVFK
mgnify:CR=1 FL=1